MTVPAQHYTTTPIADLKPHPLNPNEGDVDVIEESIRENGWYGVVLVQKSTGYTIAGWHRSLAAQRCGFTEVPTQILDVDDTTAKRIMAVDNESNRRGRYNDDTLARLLEEIADDTGLLGTGFGDDDLEQLLAATNDYGAAVTNLIAPPPPAPAPQRYDTGIDGPAPQAPAWDAPRYNPAAGDSGNYTDGPPPTPPAGAPVPEGAPAGAEPAPAWPAAPVPTDAFSVNWVVTGAQRETILAAIKKARDTLSTNPAEPIPSPQALAAVCAAYLDA